MMALGTAAVLVIGVFCFCRYQRLDRIPKPSEAQQSHMLAWGFAAGMCGTLVMTAIMRSYIPLQGDFPPNWAMVLQCWPLLLMAARYAEMKTYHTTEAEQTQAEADYAEPAESVR